VITNCDALDGIRDGQIEIRAAAISIRLRCLPRQGRQRLPQHGQVDAARAYYQGRPRPMVRALFPARALWQRTGLDRSGRGHADRQVCRRSVFALLLPDALPENFTWRDWRFTRASPCLAARRGRRSMPPILISPTRAHGGKLILWQAWPTTPPARAACLITIRPCATPHGRPCRHARVRPAVPGARRLSLPGRLCAL
jgi:feruloyl esterase